MQNPAIVMFMGATGLGIVRSLGRLDIPVFGLDSDKNAVGFYSKYCSEKIVAVDPSIDSEKCLEQLMAFGEKLNTKAVLFPASDHYVSFVSRYRKELSTYFLFNIPDKKILDQIVDKTSQYELAKKFNIPIAKTYSPKNYEELKIYYNDLKFPLFVKGRSSYDWVSKFNIKGFLVNNVNELDDVIKRAFQHNVLPLIQEIIVGPNKNHYKVNAYYSKNKELKCLFSTQKTRQYPIDFGVGSYNSSVYNEELIMLAKRFFEGIEYTGVGSMEFKLDERDKVFKLIEINPRYWQQNIQATCAGVNIPLTNYSECIGKDISTQDKFLNDVCWIDFVQDFRSFMKNRKRGDIHFIDWIKSLKNVNCHSYYSNDDIRPAFHHFKNIVIKIKNQVS